MNRDQLLYDSIFSLLRYKGYDVYDFLPPVNVKYPFIHMGEVSTEINPTKTYWLGVANISINVWGDGSNRKLVSDMCSEIIKTIKIENFTLIPSRTNQRMLKDNTTSNNLWHGIIDLYFNFN